MVFPSLPLYLDPPNWQQPPIQQQREEGGGGGRGENNNHHLPLPLPPLPSGGSGCGTGSIRPGSMTDKARLAKVPHPEAALKCPRCDSTNTKFCYFNNYSLTQPRHFCKTCRRYWTRGGALRNVPVGGGCRRNKRSSSSKGSRSKSPAPGGQGCGGGSNSSSTSSVLPSSSSDMISHFPNFLTHLNHQQLSDYGSAGEIGLSFGGIQPPIGPPTGSGGGRGNNNNEMEFNSGFAEQWRLQQGHQFHFLNNLEPQTAGNMYPFETEGVVGVEPPQSYSSQIRAKALNTAMAAVKVEDINNQQNLSRNFLGISGGHDDHNQYWINGGGGGSGGGGGGNVNAWSDLAGFNINSSLSTRHLL